MENSKLLWHAPSAAGQKVSVMPYHHSDSAEQLRQTHSVYIDGLSTSGRSSCTKRRRNVEEVGALRRSQSRSLLVWSPSPSWSESQHLAGPTPLLAIYTTPQRITNDLHHTHKLVPFACSTFNFVDQVILGQQRPPSRARQLPARFRTSSDHESSRRAVIEETLSCTVK